LVAGRVVHNLAVLHFAVTHGELMNNVGNGIRHKKSFPAPARRMGAPIGAMEAPL